MAPDAFVVEAHMSNFGDILAQGGWAAVLYLPTALMLGALHALEPGHSKGLMASFIIATRGTPMQAALLGLSAAISHSLVVWVVALVGLYFGDKLIAERVEPYLLLFSGVLVIVIALWLFVRRRDAAQAGHTHTHDSDHNHDHGAAPHSHDGGSDDAHDAAHRAEIDARFQGQRATTRDILAFGFTAGLVPCPAAITVLILCLGAGEKVLGITMVAAFSVGLALTLATVGVVTAWAAGKADTRWDLWSRVGRHAPTLSLLLMTAVGLVAVLQGLRTLPA